MELKITKDQVLAAAEKCAIAKETLKTLFPELFVDDGPVSHLSHLVDVGWIDAELSGKWLGKANIGVSIHNGKTCYFLSADYKWEIKDKCYLIPTRKTK